MLISQRFFHTFVVRCALGLPPACTFVTHIGVPKMVNASNEIRVYTGPSGKVIVYERPTAKTNNLYYRIRIPGHSKYERKSTKTSVKENAIAIAEARYAEMLHAEKNGYSVIPATVGDLLDDYIEFFTDKYKKVKHVTKYTFDNKMVRIELLRHYENAGAIIRH
jgi:hypothetical protein